MGQYFQIFNFLKKKMQEMRRTYEATRPRQGTGSKHLYNLQDINKFIQDIRHNLGEGVDVGVES